MSLEGVKVGDIIRIDSKKFYYIVTGKIVKHQDDYYSIACLDLNGYYKGTLQPYINFHSSGCTIIKNEETNEDNRKTSRTKNKSKRSSK